MILGINGILAGKGATTLNINSINVYNADNNTTDSVGGNNGTAVGGLTYITGLINQAFNFNGTNALVDFTDNSFNTLSGDFTVSMWINLASLSDRQGFFSNYKNYPATSYEFKGFRIYYGPAGHPSNTGGVRVDIGDGTNPPVNLLSNNYLTTNAWYHIVVTRKFSTATKIYINNVLSASNTSANNPALSLAYPSLGAVQYDSNLFTWHLSNNSKMDMVYFWNRDLNTSEISELYNNGNGKQYPYTFTPSTLLANLISAYNFDNNLNDSFGTNNGTGFGGISYGTTSGLINTSIGFNGANAWVELPNTSGQLNFTGDFSFSFWCKPATTSADVFLLANYITIGANNYGYYLYLKGNQSLRFGTLDGANASEMIVNQLPVVNVWTHIAITRKNSTITKMYINNVLMTPSSYSNPTLNPSYQSGIVTTIGAYASSYKYTGWMDSLDFWNKELTSTEVTELYNSGIGKQYPF